MMKKYFLPLTILVSLASCQSEVEKLEETEKQLWVQYDILKGELEHKDSVCTVLAEIAWEHNNPNYKDDSIYRHYDLQRDGIIGAQSQVLDDINKIHEKKKSIRLGHE
jgi:hypothetical protein